MEQGARLRAWRIYVGDLRGRKLTLEAAAELIVAECERRGLPRHSRRVPGTHASLTRWERGNVQQKMEGMGIIAAAYGVNPSDMMMSDPPGPPEAEITRARGA